MLVKWSHGPVAAWNFADQSKCLIRSDRTTIEELLDLCQGVAEIVEGYDLLQPREAVLGWVEERTMEPQTILQLDGARAIAPVCRAALDALERHRGFRNLTSIEVFGHGTAIDEAGRHRTVTNLTWLHATTLVHHSVSLNTQADVWLPYTLDGRPQPNSERHNAPRLEGAVRAIADRLSLFVRAVEVTDYASNDGYRLRNFIDRDGQVIDVIHRPGLVEPEEGGADL